jgi:cytochrome c-type biogenesis protein
MNGFLVRISSMLAAAPALALTGALLWGVASVLFSPCHLVSVPLLVGYLNTRNSLGAARGTVLSVLFAIGILVTIAVIGIVTAMAGRMIGDVGRIAESVIGVLLVLFGLYLLEVLRLPSISTTAAARIQGTGPVSAFLIGLVFGVGLGPCTFAFMAPVLVLVLGSAAERLWLSVGLLAAFALGHGAVIVAAGTLSQVVRQYLNWDSRSRGTRWIRRICGALIAAGGIYLMVG